MSEQHSTAEERNQFQAALNAATGQRTAEQNAANGRIPGPGAGRCQAVEGDRIGRQIASLSFGAR